MEIRSISVFYDNKGYPFQDQERTVRYPVFGNAFMGASNTTEIKFYIDKIGGNTATWVANGKLPNGVMGHQVLSATYDSDLEEYYVTFTLSSFFTQYKGDVYISLAGYDGDLDYTEETEGVYTISGTPVIQTTGSIKLNIAYSTGLVSGEEEDITFDNFFTILATKLNKTDGIIVVDSLSYVETNIANYSEDQVVYSKTEESLYTLTIDDDDNSSWELLYDFNEYRDVFGYIIQDSSISDSTELDYEQTSKEFAFIYANGVVYRKVSDDGTLSHFVSHLDFLDASSYYNVGRVEFDVNNSTGIVSNTTTLSFDFYTKDQNDDLLDEKVDETTTASQVYGTDSDGEQTTISYSESVVASNIVQRDSSGNIKVNTTPANDDEAVSKSYADDIQDEVDAEEIRAYNAEQELAGDITDINALIPSEATSDNQLADKEFVNSTVSTQTSNFLGTLDAESDLGLTYQVSTSDIVTALNSYAFSSITNNDYCYVINEDSSGNTLYQRFKARVVDEVFDTFLYEYSLNNSSFTASQWASINSTITSDLVAQITNNKTNISSNVYDSTSTYNTDDIVIYGGVLYIAIADSITGDFDSSNWLEVSVVELFSNLKDSVETTLEQVPTYYEITFATTDWELDSDDNLYKCTKETSVTDLDSDTDFVTFIPSGYVNQGYVASFGINLVDFDETTGVASFEATSEPTVEISAMLQFTRR